MQAEILPNISLCYPQAFKVGPSIATDFSGLILGLKYFLPILKVKIIHFPFPGCPSKWPRVTSETKEFINRDSWFLWKVWKEDTGRNAWSYKVMCLRNITESKIIHDKSVNGELNVIWETSSFYKQTIHVWEKWLSRCEQWLYYQGSDSTPLIS